MKILDRYVIKQFLIGYAIALCIMLGMFITLDLFVNLDEFAEQVSLSLKVVIWNIITYYGAHAALWFRDMAGVITVIASVFALARMTRNNELIAIMASGMSLKRFIAPIIVLATILTGLQAVDQELVIPNLTTNLTRAHDELPGMVKYPLWFASDANGYLWNTVGFDSPTQTIENPFIVLRKRISGTDQWIVTGRIKAKQGKYAASQGGWVLTQGEYLQIPDYREANVAEPRRSKVDFLATDLTPEQIPLRRQEKFKSLLSSSELNRLAQSKGTRQSDLAELYLQKHSRITDPILNLIMLLVALPVLVCRDPRDMKTAILISFTTTSACFVFTFVCKMFATEVFFGQIRPELWAWAPIFVFLPVAFIQMDSMKT